LDWPSAREDSPVAFTTAASLVHQLMEGRDEICASWMVESGPAVMKKAASMASTTARASGLCTRPGDKLERMK